MSGRDVAVRIDETADLRVVIPGLEVVEPCFGIVVIAAILQGIDRSHFAGCSEDLTIGIISVGSSFCTICIHQIRHIALKVRDIIVNRRVGAVIVNQRIGCSGVVIAEIQRLACPIRLNGFPQQLSAGIDVAMRLGDGFLQNTLRCAAAGHRCSSVSQTILRNRRLRVCDFYDGRAVGIAAASASEVSYACPLECLREISSK